MAWNAGCESVTDWLTMRRMSGGSLLMLERLLGFVEHPHVFDRDHRLVGENLQQLDLVVGEHSGFAPGHVECADGGFTAHQWNEHDAAESSGARQDALLLRVRRFRVDDDAWPPRLNYRPHLRALDRDWKELMQRLLAAAGVDVNA
jgi:hypothetical protein